MEWTPSIDQVLAAQREADPTWRPAWERDDGGDTSQAEMPYEVEMSCKPSKHAAYRNYIYTVRARNEREAKDTALALLREAHPKVSYPVFDVKAMLPRG